MLSLFCPWKMCAATYELEGKFFPIFNLITTKVNKFTAAELLEQGRMYSNAWPEFNETIANSNFIIPKTIKDFHKP